MFRDSSFFSLFFNLKRTKHLKKKKTINIELKVLQESVFFLGAIIVINEIKEGGGKWKDNQERRHAKTPKFQERE